MKTYNFNKNIDILTKMLENIERKHLLGMKYRKA